MSPGPLCAEIFPESCKPEHGLFRTAKSLKEEASEGSVQMNFMCHCRPLDLGYYSLWLTVTQSLVGGEMSAQTLSSRSHLGLVVWLLSHGEACSIRHFSCIGV